MTVHIARTLTVVAVLAASPALARPDHETAQPSATAQPAPTGHAAPHAPDGARPHLNPTEQSTPPHADRPEPHSEHARPAPTQGHSDHDHGDHAHGVEDLQGVQGAYPIGRDASGTSWQPDVSQHGGVMAMRNGWMLMGHAHLNGVYDWQNGPRGDEKAFVSGMIMGTARFDRANGDTINLRAMVSPDPFMGKRGYPLLLAAGETADGATELVDRQHPHELVMELSASYAHRLSAEDSVFVYAGVPGEPAFGPPAFMHRLSAMDSPEAPITHHWLDSTHITFGVLTGGYVRGNAKLEVSGFRGREPDQDRFDIEEPKIDSVTVRGSWNPTPQWALQLSWADVRSPEQLHPDEDETRWSASAIYTRRLGGDAWWSTTAAVARKERSDGVDLDAGALETALRLRRPWTVFARAEVIESDELGAHGADPETVGKASIGAVRDFRVSRNAVFGVGALYSKNWLPSPLEAPYGGDEDGAMAFVRLKIG